MSAPLERDRFRLANGDLSAYAFGCGYVQSWTVDGGSDYYGTSANGVSLYRDGATWHVRTRETGRTHDERGMALWLELGSGRTRADWQTFDTLGEARAAFRRQVAALRAGRPVELAA